MLHANRASTIARAARHAAFEMLEQRRLLSGDPLDFGDAPDAYRTTLATGGAHHWATPNMHLGLVIDSELDGQPSADAMKDDLTGSDDEDGIRFLDPIVPGTSVRVEVINGAGGGRLNAWLDFNIDGNFDPPDQIFTDVFLPSASLQILSFFVPTFASPGDTYARFRLNEAGGIGPILFGDFGEVEDYQVKIEGNPGGDLDWGDAPDSYATLMASNGPNHMATPNILLGNAVDTEPDGQPGPNANRDDLNGVPDDEDGVQFLDPIVPGGIVRVNVTTGAGAGRLNAWLDFNINGQFDAPDQIFTNVALPGASTTMLSFMVPAGAPAGTSYARFRLNVPGGLGPKGPGGFGEVEDYRVRIDGPDQQLDFGDAPFSTAGPFFYPTTFASGDPARHVLAPNGPQLGPSIDPEADGQPNLTATGDDIANIDDENGITVGAAPFETVPLISGLVVPVEVTNAGPDAFLNAWFDWNQDGDWADPGEQVATDVLAPTGLSILNVAVPAGVTPGSFVYSRFRLSSATGLDPKGLAPDGEVEDYRNRVEGEPQQLDFGDAPDAVGTPFMYPTMLGGVSGNPARHVIFTPGPRLGNLIDPEPDGQQTLLASGDDANGIDDEDGVRVGGVPLDLVPIVAGSTMTLQVTNGGGMNGFLNAWFDWNENGNWEAAEQVATNLPMPPGVTLLNINVPGHLTANSNVYSRFRINGNGGLGTTGLAQDGEVEDYRSRALPDTVQPRVLSGGLEYETRQAVRLIFSEPLNPATVQLGDLAALNLDDGTTPVANSVILSAGNTVATWVFNTPGTFISDGDYSFTIAAGAVSDVAGNGLAGAFNLAGPAIFFLGGDANRDRSVTLIDFNTLAANFGTSGKPFSGGNFNYDAAGDVTLPDFNILAARFGMSVAPTATSTTGGESPFGDSMIGEEEGGLEMLV